MKTLRWIVKFLPTLFTALILAIFVWVSAVSSTDPNEEREYATPVPVTVLGLDPDLVITGQLEDEVKVRIRAPRSVQERLAANPDAVHAYINLSGLTAGEHTLEPQIAIDLSPTRVTLVTPPEITLTLENILSKEVPVELRLTGSLPIGYEAGEAVLSHDTAVAIGPESQVLKVERVVAGLDLNNVSTSISRQVELKALDARGVIVSGINLNPTQVTVEIPVTQLGGYRNVFVKIVTTGQIAQGFYLTGILADPPTITIYSTDPELAANMPAFIETTPLNLNGASESFQKDVNLNLPEGIVVVGDQQVSIHVSISAIQSSILLTGIPVEISNLGQGLKAALSPDRVDIYVSGPLYLLDKLNAADIIVMLDLANKTPGTYQLIPTVTLADTAINLDSILPASIEVVITR
ncbi:MAG TPA: CdaR family protein [Anaerolineaceae bacterium]|jgi:YbbR domain-containing protein|nr:CdaR family protein [Anaerolineaceae bacterium]HPS33303.1 CdaR family protein [Anaerolineaceae bacterium]